MSGEEEKNNFPFRVKEFVVDPLVSLWSASVEWIRQHIVNEVVSFFYDPFSQDVDPVVIVEPITTTEKVGEDGEVCFRTIPDIQPDIPSDLPDIACECGERCGGEELQKGGGEEGADL